MAIVFMDGIGVDYDRPSVGGWTNYATDSTGEFGAYGRDGRRGGITDHTNRTFTMQLPSSYSSLYVGMAAYHVGSGGFSVYRLYNGSTRQLTLYVESSGLLSVYNAADTQIAVSSLTVPAGYNHFSMHVGSFHATTGSVSAKVNGTTYINATNVNTLGGGSSTIDRFVFWPNTFDEVRWSDLWIDDSTDHGDCKVYSLMPNGAGTTTTSSIGGSSPPANAWQAVDDKSSDGVPFPNDGVDYVSFASTGDKDTYAVEDSAVANVGNPIAVGVWSRAQASTGSATVRNVLRYSGTEVEGPDTIVGTAWASTKLDVYETKPGGGAWTAMSEVNALEIGVKRTA